MSPQYTNPGGAEFDKELSSPLQFPTTRAVFREGHSPHMYLVMPYNNRRPFSNCREDNLSRRTILLAGTVRQWDDSIDDASGIMTLMVPAGLM